MDQDLDDTHLCIKCNGTIIGLENYIKHRKTNCRPTIEGVNVNVNVNDNIEKLGNTVVVTSAENDMPSNAIAYDDQYNFVENPSEEAEPPTAVNSHNDKANYDLHYELGADVFFSSLQLQSVQPSSTGGKTAIATTTTTAAAAVAAVAASATATTAHQANQLQRIKSLQQDGQIEHEASWLENHAPPAAVTQHNSDNLLKAVTAIGESKKSFEPIFKTIVYENESADDDVTEDDDDDDNDNDVDGVGDGDVEVEVENEAEEGEVELIEDDLVSDLEMEEDDDDDDEDYHPLAEGHSPGGKWKLSSSSSSIVPVVPISHTGGKWKPENRPNLRVTHSQLTCVSPTSNWYDHVEDLDGNDEQQQQHPPSYHTKGKWIPGTKLQKIYYKDESVELRKSYTTTSSSTNPEYYWCNICCRKLKSKINYEHHLKTNYHLKRAEPEQQLEKAVIEELPAMIDITKSLLFEITKRQGEADKKLEEEEAEREPEPEPRPQQEINEKNLEKASKDQAKNSQISQLSVKRKRRHTYLKCHLCKHYMLRHLIGKHLISHYHYRRMQMHPGASLKFILENIHSIVRQSPFQCRPCHFYANTEDAFLNHWNSNYHEEYSKGPGIFCCIYCQYECDRSEEMFQHLLGTEHKEILSAINRSVPIYISKRLRINCTKCSQQFRYNFELRQHMLTIHPGVKLTATISDAYQSRFYCNACPEILKSKIALQRHEKYKHCILKYFCSICDLQFKTAGQARRHRKTAKHKINSARMLNKKLPSSTASPFDDKIEAKRKEADITDLPCTSKMAKAREQLAKSLEKMKSLERCNDCTKIFTSKIELNKHHQLKHKPLLYTCMSCGESYTTAQALGRHVRLCWPSSTLRPTSNATKAKHKNIISKAIGAMNGQWHCKECNFSANFQSELLYHQLYHTYGKEMTLKQQKIQCPLCEKTFRKHSLRCHLRQHTNEKIFECDICHAKYSRRYNLTDHINKIHNKELSLKKSQLKIKSDANKQNNVKHQCDSCGKIYKYKHSLKLHTTSEHDVTSTRKFVCPVENCYYAAGRKFLLKIHSLSHSAEHLKCEERNCNYVGKSLLHLKRHMQKSHLSAFTTSSTTTTTDSSLTMINENSLKTYNCTKCNFKTRTNSHLQRHMRSHTGERPFQCSYCEFRCSSWENLRKHVLKTGKHPGKFMYECDLCQKDMEQQSQQEQLSHEIFKTNSHFAYKNHLKMQHVAK